MVNAIIAEVSVAVIGKGFCVGKGATIFFKDNKCLKKCLSGVATVSALEKYKKLYGDLNFQVMEIEVLNGNVMIYIKKGIAINEDFFCNNGECIHCMMVENKEL